MGGGGEREREREREIERERERKRETERETEREREREIRNTLSAAGNSMTSSERPSLEPPLKKRGVLSRTEGERILEMLWKPRMP